MQLIVACINRMDFYQNEENASIYKALQILEQWIEIQPEISIKLTENTNIFEFLIKTLQPNIPVDETKMCNTNYLKILIYLGIVLKYFLFYYLILKIKKDLEI